MEQPKPIEQAMEKANIWAGEFFPAKEGWHRVLERVGQDGTRVFLGWEDRQVGRLGGGGNSLGTLRWILTPLPVSPVLHWAALISASDFTGGDPSNPIGMAGTSYCVKGWISPYSKLCSSHFPTCVRYGTG